MTYIEFTLIEEKNLSILAFCNKSDKSTKSSLVSVAISLNKTIICNNFVQCAIFKEELGLFDNTDDTTNKYFTHVYRKINDLNSKKLLFTLKDEKYYFSRVEARMILYIWNIFINTYSHEELFNNTSFPELYYKILPRGY